MKTLVPTLKAALGRKPRCQDALVAVQELAWLTPIMTLCVTMSETMQWSAAFDAATLRMALVAFVLPAFFEELVFRGVLLRKISENRQFPLKRAVIALGLFVLWHPFQSFFTSDARATIFLDPWFLAAVTALGLACTRVYWRTGSLWPAIGIHWLTVVGWKALAGGPALT